MSEGQYVDTLIDDYETLLTQTLLKNSRGEYNESEILKESWFRQIGAYPLHGRS